MNTPCLNPVSKVLVLMLFLGVPDSASSQTAGVAALGPGISTLQAMFSVLDQALGRFFSPDEPLWFGPRHCGQLSAEATKEKFTRAVARALNERSRFMAHPFQLSIRFCEA